MNATPTGLEPVTQTGESRKDRFRLEDFVPIGTFAGWQDVILRIRNGKPVPANTGDQGGGQN
jgi:hypothetical protein